MSPFLISINDAAKALGLGRSKIYQLIQAGDLAIVKIGRRTLISMKSVQTLSGDLGDAL